MSFELGRRSFQLRGEEAGEGAELLAAVGEELAYPFFGYGVEGLGAGAAMEAEEEGVHGGDGVEAATGDGVAGEAFEGGFGEDGDGAAVGRAGRGGEAGGGFALEHQDEALGEGAVEQGVEPGGADGVREVGDNFESAVDGGGGIGGEAGAGVFDGVALEEVEGFGVGGEEGFAEAGFEEAVNFDSVNIGTGGKEGVGEGAKAGADFDDGVAGGDGGEFEGFADDVAVGEEILAEARTGDEAELVEEGAGLGGGEGHGARSQKLEVRSYN